MYVLSPTLDRCTVSVTLPLAQTVPRLQTEILSRTQQQLELLFLYVPPPLQNPQSPTMS